jgi:prepilin signal peptidase PulO-like enzyme (type II secretory pathway)
MIYALLAFFGVCLGSFVNALVWRTHQRVFGKGKDRDLSVLNGRSMCPHCRHELAAADLVPLFSWLWLRGKCRYCKKPIAWQYPLVELSLGLVFVVSYIFWSQPLHGGQTVLFATWLAASVGLMALLVYDLKWMLLPNSILYPTFLVVFAGQLAHLIGYQVDKPQAALNWALSVTVAAGIFWFLFMLSRGQWIGFGDVRLGLISGTLLQTPAKSFLMIFLASLLGMAVIIPLIAFGKRRLSAKIPYGPFLIAATFICLLFGNGIIDWYKKLAGF